MFGIHRRNRSLIPVSELSKYDTKEPLLVQQEKQLELELESEQELEDAKEPRLDRQQSSQLALIYTLFLAEAIMAASMSSQINMLDASLSDNATNCSSNLRNQYLLSILQCMYCFGSACGVFWGRLADRQGRRRVALGGLVGMSACCVAMGFVRSFAGCVVLRAISGVASSAATTAGLAMLADSSVDSIERTRRVARLPLLAACGAVGPLLQSVVARLGEGSMTGIWESWPILSGQIACASLIGMIAIGEACCLKEVSCRFRVLHRWMRRLTLYPRRFACRSLHNASLEMTRKAHCWHEIHLFTTRIHSASRSWITANKCVRLPHGTRRTYCAHHPSSSCSPPSLSSLYTLRHSMSCCRISDIHLIAMAPRCCLAAGGTLSPSLQRRQLPSGSCTQYRRL